MKTIEHTSVTIGGKKVPAQKTDITQREYFQAAAIGLKPQAVYTVRGEYFHGEDRLTTHRGEVLAIYRTYRDGVWIELYCERRAGIHG
ncbi:MAG: hypothetical protein IKS06_01935 [Lachnospiraceae bacterium]|nr:hypothetical protein [Lachnospiraceae bacterium]